MASNPDRFRPVIKKTANWVQVEQNDVHQQLRVSREAPNSNKVREVVDAEGPDLPGEVVHVRTLAAAGAGKAPREVGALLVVRGRRQAGGFGLTAAQADLLLRGSPTQVAQPSSERAAIAAAPMNEAMAA